MNRLGKSMLMIAAITLLLTTSALALPVAGTYVKMQRDWEVPYTMTDLQTGKTYQTFCVESQNYFYPGSTYKVESVGNYVTGGGGGAINGMGDELSPDTKWLYAAYMSGEVEKAGYSAIDVQHAIWWLEEELYGDEAVWNDLSKIAFDDSGWNVVAVNLISYNQYGRKIDNQSQLVGAPVPEPATLLLLGTGLVGLAGFGRRKLKK